MSSNLLRRAARPAVETLEDRLAPAIFTVTNLADAGPGSLRQAILNANARPGLDTVAFRPGLQGSIQMSSGEQMRIIDSLFLAGPGAGRLSVNGLDQTRIFEVNTPGSVTIKDLALINGRAPIGGAIRSVGNLTLVRTVLSGNEATSLEGGAVSAFGSLTLSGCVVSDNRAFASGGGIDALGTVLINRTRITDNACQASGGGLNLVGTVTISQCTIAGNRTSVEGGGLSLRSGTATLRDSVVFGNETRNGGGLFATGDVGSLSVERCAFTGNMAATGGGLATGANLTSVLDSTFTLNRAEASGGGLASTSPLRMIRTTVANNRAVNGDGGGIFQTDGAQACSLTLTACTVSGNRAELGLGGGVFVANTSLESVIRGSTLSANRAGGGGGLWIQASPTFLLQNSTVSGNWARSDGGGVAASAPGLLQNCTIAFNRAGLGGFGSGGGIINLNFDLVRLESTIVANNSAVSGGSDLSGPFTASFCLIRNPGGGGITDGEPGSNLFFQDPFLAPLAFNGGPTQTHALMRGSAAINRGSNPAGLTTDQRGVMFVRQRGAAVDIGAFELA